MTTLEQIERIKGYRQENQNNLDALLEMVEKQVEAVRLNNEVIASLEKLKALEDEKA